MLSRIGNFFFCLFCIMADCRNIYYFVIFMPILKTEVLKRRAKSDFYTKKI